MAGLIRRDSGVYYLKYCDASGKVRRRSLGTRDRREAEMLRRQFEAARENRKHEAKPCIGIIELAERYTAHARDYYRRADGSATQEAGLIVDALRVLCGVVEPDRPAADFTPSVYRKVRQAMLDSGRFSRKTINEHMSRIKRMMRWAVSREMVRPELLVALQTVEPLKRGRSAAREPESVEPVLREVIEATKAATHRIIADMIEVQLLSGARPGEVCGLRVGDIDTKGDVWTAVLQEHKMVHRGRERALYFGPRAQAVLRGYIDGRAAREYVFRPCDAVRRDRYRVDARATGGRKPGGGYSVASYRRAIARACEAAGVKAWAPNQLRHTRATEIRRLYGLDAAQVILGHASADVTQIYAETDKARAVGIVGEIG